MRLTGVVISMAAWEKRFRILAEENEVKIYMSKIFVDDQNLLFRSMKKGTRWTGKSMEWSSKWEDEDENSDEPDDSRNMKEIKKMSNVIRKDIVMEYDIPSNYRDLKLPILDFKVWKVDTEIEGQLHIHGECKVLSTQLTLA